MLEQISSSLHGSPPLPRFDLKAGEIFGQSFLAPQGTEILEFTNLKDFRTHHALPIAESITIAY